MFELPTSQSKYGFSRSLFLPRPTVAFGLLFFVLGQVGPEAQNTYAEVEWEDTQIGVNTITAWDQAVALFRDVDADGYVEVMDVVSGAVLATFVGEPEDWGLGAAVVAMGDATGDGLPDLGTARAGGLALLFGSASGPIPTTTIGCVEIALVPDAYTAFLAPLLLPVVLDASWSVPTSLLP